MATAKVYQNLVGSTKKAKFPAVMGSELSVNMYYGRNGKQEYMESLPGLRRLANIGGRCRGCYVSTIGLRDEASPEDMFAVMGNVLFRIDAEGNHTRIGRVAGNGKRVSFAETGGPRALMLVADGSSLWYYDLLNGGELKPIQLPERITAGGGTVTPSHVCVCSGSIVVNDTGSGYWYYSDPFPLSQETREMYVVEGDHVVYEDDGVTIKTEEVEADRHVFENEYGVPQYRNSYTSSDNVNAVYSSGAALLVFGPKTVEIWQRGSGEYEDWIRTSYTEQDSFGLEAPNSLASSGGSVYFVASGAKYGKCVMKVTGTQFEKVSEEFLEEKLLEENTDSAFGFCYSVGEHNFYCLQTASLGECWTYDGLDGGWHQRCSRNATTGVEVRWKVSGVAYYREKFYAFTDDGLVCRFHDDYWMEDNANAPSLPMVRHRQTPVMTDGLKPYVIEELAVELNVGTWQDLELQPMLLLEVSKDGGMTWGNVRSASMGRTGDYSHRVRFHNVGMNRLGVIRISYSHPTDLVLTACSIRAESTGAMI